MKPRSASLLASFTALGFSTAAAHAQVTSPEEHLGRPLGTDFQLADYEQVSSWYRLLDEQSDRVITQSIGMSTEGREFLISIISSPENLANLEEHKKYAAILADPRGRTEEEKAEAIANGKVILLISPQMHSTEAAGAEAGMQFAHLLATSEEEPWTSARENLIVGIFPCTNPDGLDHVVHWYRETVGSPFEATGMLKLYQLYTGHDNNRDWFMLTQAETRIVTEQLYTVWRPQVYWDVHQQGGRAERMFVPPFRDPLNPNLDPAIIAGIDAIGSRALLDMTREGFTGISTGVTYDMWWNGGNRNVPVRHNIIGLLTEAASVDIATPVFLRRTDLEGPGHLTEYAPSNQFPAPWPGGWWRLSNIIDYQVAFGKSLVGTLARDRELWLRNALEASERTIAKAKESAPKAWIIPFDNRDPDAVRRLIDVLQRTGVEVHQAHQHFIADGRQYGAGSVVIFRDQPYGNHVKDLFEVQRYPEGAPPYDVAGWSLPLLLGVRRVEVMGEIDGSALRPFELFAPSAVRPWEQRRGILTSSSSRVWEYIFSHPVTMQPITFITTGEEAGWFTWEVEAGPFEGMVRDDRPELVEEAPADPLVKDTNPPQAPTEIIISSLPRIGLYSPWAGSMDEGWMRWVLDEWEIPYTTVRNEQLRAGALHDFLDVLIIPDIGPDELDEGRPEGTIPDQYARGLAPEGAVAIEEFVRTGGTLLTFDSSSDWAIELFRLPLIDVTREAANGDFSCPGSVLRAIPDLEQPINAGLPDSVALFFSNSRAWREMTEEERKVKEMDPREMTTLLRYAPTRVLLSGWINRQEVIANRAAWIEAEHGEGRVHLFAFRPQYRGWSQATFPLIFRACLLKSPSKD
jgi:hypothetical protein